MSRESCKYCRNWNLDTSKGPLDSVGTCSVYTKETRHNESCNVGIDISIADKMIGKFEDVYEEDGSDAITVCLMAIFLGMFIEVLIAVLTPAWLTIGINIIIAIIAAIIVDAV